MPPAPPPCAALGSQCRALPVTILIASYTKPGEVLDPEATWLLGHTETLAFRNLRQEGKDLLVDATMRVRCRHLKRDPSLPPGEVRCAAHGYTGTVPEDPWPAQPRRLGGDRFRIVVGDVQDDVELSLPPRQLPVIPAEDDINPCSLAPCTTADHRRGSACCRDMQLEIRCPEDSSTLELLLRNRQSPYFCKVSRERPGWIEGELINTCDYLDEERLNCTLHGRSRPDGRPAKPDLCTEWPDDGKGLHPGCLWYDPPKRKAHST